MKYKSSYFQAFTDLTINFALLFFGNNLQRYHDEVEKNSNMFDNIVKLSMTDCYNNLWLALYDEDNKKFLTIEEANNELQKIKNE